MYFCVFSYNRGRYLANCVQSIEANVTSADIRVFDDDSDDPETRMVLKRIGRNHEVISAKNTGGSEFHNGGLCQNMQAAVNMLPKDATVCFVQDDMQIVRRLDNQDLRDINIYFESNAKAAFLHPAFMKGANRKRDSASSRWCETSRCYFREVTGQSAGICFSDVLITRIARLRNAGWVFENREKLNEARAQRQFGKMGFMRNPFLMWLPNVSSYRGRKRTLALRLGEKWRASGFYPFEPMSENERSNFITREPSALPFAEDFLRLRDSQLPEPWVYYPLERINLLRYLNRVELYFYRLFSRT